MPSIKDAMGANLSGYRETGPNLPVVVQMITDNKPRANPSIRCPLPPFNSDPDTLRQFEGSGTLMPQVRVIPLPPILQAAASTATATGVLSTSASTPSSFSPTTLTAQSVSLATGGLAAGSSFTGSVQMAKSFQLLALTADVICEVRLYGAAAVQSFDNARVEGDPVPPEITSNIITCVTFDTLPYAWAWQNSIGANQDTPQTKTIYVTVYNTDTNAVSNINVSISFLPLES